MCCCLCCVICTCQFSGLASLTEAVCSWCCQFMQATCSCSEENLSVCFWLLMTIMALSASEYTMAKSATSGLSLSHYTRLLFYRSLHVYSDPQRTLSPHLGQTAAITIYACVVVSSLLLLFVLLTYGCFSQPGYNSSFLPFLEMLGIDWILFFLTKIICLLVL